MSDWISLFDGSLEVAPPLGDEQLQQIPARRGVLSLLAADGRPILLLTAADIRSRLRTRLAEPLPEERKKTADLREITRRILWKLSDGHFETDLNFFELARRIWPAAYAELLSWKMAWFVHVDPAEQFPHFVRTRDAGLRPGLYVGPFEGGRSADKFIEALEDAFDLCRDYACLRQSPNGPPCAYLQMGRCVGPCNGTISLEEYRQIVASAAALAAGDHAALRHQMQTRMKAAAADLKFELASTIKARLARLDVFEKDEYRHVRPLEEFRFIVVQRGRGKKLDVFLVNGGEIAKAAPLDWPSKPEALDALLAAMAAAPPMSARLDDVQRWRLGLAAHYLFSGQERRGAMVRYHARLTRDELAAEIEHAFAAKEKPSAPKPPQT